LVDEVGAGESALELEEGGVGLIEQRQIAPDAPVLVCVYVRVCVCMFVCVYVCMVGRSGHGEVIGKGGREGSWRVGV
jgi:hypothetical protein